MNHLNTFIHIAPIVAVVLLALAGMLICICVAAVNDTAKKQRSSIIPALDATPEIGYHPACISAAVVLLVAGISCATIGNVDPIVWLPFAAMWFAGIFWLVLYRVFRRAGV